MDEELFGRRIGFLGGSFDPPHMGHLAVARAACEALALDTVLFAPVGAQPLKPGGAAASFEDRAAMTRLAIAGEPGFELSLVDAPKSSGAPNYTLETLISLRAGLAAGGVLFCLMGADAFVGLKGWRGADKIPFVAPLVVASRPGLALEGLAAVLPSGLTLEDAGIGDAASSKAGLCISHLRNSAGESAPFYLLPGLNVDVSASEIRREVQAVLGSREAGAGLLPDAVASYIRSHGLYQ
jgi:nicotinate-nucleotide adenylyltransferase